MQQKLLFRKLWKKDTSMFFRSEKIHFIGIGGAGMCPIAEFMHANNHIVSGSDLIKTKATERLEALGIPIQYNHTPEKIRSAELIVYSSAVKSENYERIYAAENGIRQLKRAKFLGDIMRNLFSVAVAGTHGKTTTSSLIGSILNFSKMDPTVIIGGAFKESESNVIIGKGNVMVVEADEYDRSLLSMYPSIAVITNIEAEHLDIYDGLSDIKKTFVEFVNRIPFNGMAVLCVDDVVTEQIINQIEGRIITYGLSKKADYRAENIRSECRSSKFELIKNNISMGTVSIPLIGDHNIRNSLAAITVASEMNISFPVIQEGLNRYQGMKRRFEIVGNVENITVADDYAHHPTEIEVTLTAAKNAGYGRVIAVFQPHLYSRTRDFLNDFAKSLMKSDIVVVTDIYKAREEPISGVESINIVKIMNENGYRNALYIDDMYNISDKLAPMVLPNDIIILMGAGDIWKIGNKLLKRIRNV